MFYARTNKSSASFILLIHLACVVVGGLTVAVVIIKRSLRSRVCPSDAPRETQAK